MKIYNETNKNLNVYFFVLDIVINVIFFETGSFKTTLKNGIFFTLNSEHENIRLLDVTIET